MPTLHFIEGPVGAGKTTYALGLAREIGCPPFVLDNWMVNLFQPDRPDHDLWPWYAERKTRCVSQIMTSARSALDLGNDAIVELGLIRRSDRQELYAELDAEARHFLVHVLGTPREERQQRVLIRNTEQGETFAMHVSNEVFNIASDMWEPIGAPEQQGRSDNFHFVK